MLTFYLLCAVVAVAMAAVAFVVTLVPIQRALDTENPIE